MISCEGALKNKLFFTVKDKIYYSVKNDMSFQYIRILELAYFW